MRDRLIPLALGLVLAVAGCGGDDESSGGGGSERSAGGGGGGGEQIALPRPRTAA